MRIFFRNLAIAIVGILLSTSVVMADATQEHYKYGDMNVLVITWTAAANGTFASFETQKINGVVGVVETDPGATAPTADYDITLKNQGGVDIMDGKLANRSDTATEAQAPYISSEELYLTYPVRGPLTLAITNNSVNSATGTVTIYYYTGKNVH